MAAVHAVVVIALTGGEREPGRDLRLQLRVAQSMVASFSSGGGTGGNSGESVSMVERSCCAPNTACTAGVSSHVPWYSSRWLVPIP